MIQKRHLKTLSEVIDSDILDLRIKKDLIVIQTFIAKELEHRAKNPHFREDTEEI